MRRQLLHPAAAAAVLALLLGLSACSSGADDPDPSPAAASGTPETGSDDSDDGSDDGGLPVGPLDDYIGVGAGAALSTDDAEYLEFEEEIARCMAAEGFEYVPFVPDVDATLLPDGSMTLDVTGGSFPDLPPDEFAARFGYGISTEPPADREEQRDPNEAIVARMSVAERVAYHQALYGDVNTLDDRGYLAGTAMSNTETSCVGRADAGEPTADERRSAEKRAQRVRDSFASLLKRVGDLRDEQLADPRVEAATSSWSSCLAAAGHRGFTELDQPRARARDDARKLLGPDLSGMADADPTRLAALRTAEVDLAVADEACLRDWRRTFRAVKLDTEERFVRDNLEELEAFRTAMAAAVADQE
ncbi:hypothetical protein [Nocardioides soli]|uniref:Uncharacterized protein n=1 Tax=Nocardioides soli TaxID=1036020 RepID=A0A7W4Z3W9_9ACTN|nr:hypothetical protein [Nocardioides soli]MBB3045452.1 hypothetical protein [Nocardioides soli]